MLDFMKTIISAVKNYVKKSTADWNQNDENALNHVKNRTHYDSRIANTKPFEIVIDSIDDKEKVVLSSFEEDGVRRTIGVFKASENLLTSEDIKSCKYKFSNDEEIFICDLYDYYPRENFSTLWNVMVVMYEDGEYHNGYSDDIPWPKITLSKGLWLNYCLIEPLDGSESELSWVSEIQGVYTSTSGHLKKLDKKYVPDNLSWEDIGGKVLYQGVGTGEFENVNFVLEEGKTYTVIFNGEVYECVAWYSESYLGVIVGDGSCYEIEDNQGKGEPFFIDYYFYDGTCYMNYRTDELGEDCSFVLIEGKFTQIPKAYIPGNFLAIDNKFAVIEEKLIATENNFTIIGDRFKENEWKIAHIIPVNSTGDIEISIPKFTELKIYGTYKNANNNGTMFKFFINGQDFAEVTARQSTTDAFEVKANVEPYNYINAISYCQTNVNGLIYNMPLCDVKVLLTPLMEEDNKLRLTFPDGVSTYAFTYVYYR